MTARPTRSRVAALALVPAGAAILLSGACATKGDIRRIETAMEAIRIQQDSSLAALNRAVLDGQAASDKKFDLFAGEVRLKLRQSDQQMSRIENISTQAQRGTVEVKRAIEKVRAAAEAADSDAPAPQPAPQAPAATAAPKPATPTPATSRPAAPATTTATKKDASRKTDRCWTEAEGDEILRQSRQVIRQRLPGTATAREGATEFLRCFGDKAGAPEARLILAESYALEGRYDQAIPAYAEVLRYSPNSPFAPTALYRQAMAEIERGDKVTAASLMERVVAKYPTSHEATLAKASLTKLRNAAKGPAAKAPAPKTHRRRTH